MSWIGYPDVLTSPQDLRKAYDNIVDPLLAATRRELNSIIARLHRLDLGQSGAAAGYAGPSTYIKDLSDKLNFIKNEVFAKFNVGDTSREWYGLC